MKNDKETSFAASQKSKSGLLRVWRAFLYSCGGFAAAYRHEHAFRQEVWLFAPLSVAVCLSPMGIFHKALLIASFVAVLGFEMINSALEAIVDDISLEKREFAKRAKDCGSAAVFCMMVCAGILMATILFLDIRAGVFDGWGRALQSVFNR